MNKLIIPALLLFAVPSLAQVADSHGMFITAEQCLVCHNNVSDAEGNDISIGHSWRATMMALSAKDPYWMAGVRRESIDHPTAIEEIEDTCSVCHMPMARTLSASRGEGGQIFAHLDGTYPFPEETAVGADGVSCTVCHQIKADNLGSHASFDGGYEIDLTMSQNRSVYGPFEPDAGRTRVMQSATGYVQTESTHIQQSELCATCHTLYTPTLDDAGNVVAEFPEQMPYIEWQHSSYSETDSCQSCHMPIVAGDNAVTSVLGQPRPEVSQHSFLGGNAFMLGLLDRYRDELGVSTPSDALQESIERTEEHLATATASLEISAPQLNSGVAAFDITVENLAGHKLPTAYPSRRVWLHVEVTDQSGRVVFESGAPNADGSITGNDNDADANAFEPHYDEITSEDQVQIYEPIIHDYRGEITTSLLSAAAYVKDNRIPPHGFDKHAVSEDVAVHGPALTDDDFNAGRDIVSYRIEVGDGVSSVSVSARLLFQPIGYRWASNLRSYQTFETNRFVGYFDDNARDSFNELATARR